MNQLNGKRMHLPWHEYFFTFSKYEKNRTMELNKI